MQNEIFVLNVFFIGIRTGKGNFSLVKDISMGGSFNFYRIFLGAPRNWQGMEAIAYAASLLIGVRAVI